ncbi:hypothetical protein L596_021001 [Steinernema carpocapsae]|uniref:Uncharacterized protein n=2 Tax=Steinernema carpocapsae TaxID=34508 RepID=A0A4U5MVW8_STECR|nr:hypothetical protein L596_021001 [Steinernema carpocapsae]
MHSRKKNANKQPTEKHKRKERLHVGKNGRFGWLQKHSSTTESPVVLGSGSTGVFSDRLWKMFAIKSSSGAWLCVLLLAAAVYETQAGSGSTESGQARDRKAKSKDLTDTTDSNGNCLLVATMWNISLQLSGEEAIEWHAILDEANMTAHNSSLTSDDIIVKISAEIKMFFMKFPDCNEKFRYFTIGGWGDFSGLFQVTIWINADFTESVITLENGKCKLEDALLEFESTISDQSEKDALDELRAEIDFCIKDTSLSYEEKMANLSLTFINFFKLHAAWEVDIRGIDIPGFGSIDAFLEVSMQFYRMANFFQLFVVAPGQTDCQLVVDLTSEMNNAKYNFSRSEKTSLTDFIGNIRVLIAGNASLSITAKIKAVVYQYSQLMMTSSFLKFRLREFNIGVAFDFGTFGDLLDASDFGSRFPPTSPPTTSPAPTTTPVQGDCSKAPDVLSIFNGNMTIFYQSSDTFLKNNPGTQATNWRPYLNMCQNQAIMNSTLSVQDKIKKIGSIITTYVGTNSARISFVYSITITGWGNYKQFCTCGGF